MNTGIFKAELKNLLNKNPQKIKFTITGIGVYEVYETRKLFGARLLDIFKNEKLDIILTSATEKNCLGYSVSSFSWIERNIPNNLSLLEFMIIKKEKNE